MSQKADLTAHESLQEFVSTKADISIVDDLTMGLHSKVFISDFNALADDVD